MIRTLHIDIEGGYGGSSRSLYELVRRLDRDRFAPLVVHRREGPIAGRYAEIDIPTAHVPEIFSYAPRPRNSGKIFLANLPGLPALRRGVARIAALAREHGAAVIHLNYEGLFLMAGPLRRATGLPLVGHSRTLIPENPWGRWVVRSLARQVAHMFFITTREAERFAALAPRTRPPGDVMWNIATPAACAADPVKTEIPEAIFLGNHDVTKAPDRMLDIAAALDARNAPPLKLVIYGSARTNRDYGRMLADRIDRENLGHRVSLAGHIADPEAATARAFALIRPSRDNDPWGRDVIEAVSAGVPVLATGSYDKVVEPGVNGYLFEPFDAGAMADRLLDLLARPDLRRRMHAAGREKGARQFGGTDQAALASRVFAAVAGHSTDSSNGTQTT